MYKIDLYYFDKYFRIFKNYIFKQDGSQLISFPSSRILEEQEGYKDDVHDYARKLLQYWEWKENDIGSGKIIDSVVASIYVKSLGGIGNNLVDWRLVDKFAKLAENSSKFKEYEKAFFDFYRNKILDEDAFNLFMNYFGGNYPLIAYFFFIKDKARYLPISSTRLDKSLRRLGVVDFRTSHRCSWENYNQFLRLVRDTKELLINEGVKDVSLLNAHSFLWMLDEKKDEMKAATTNDNETREKDDPLETIINERETITVQELIKNYDILGIPHFQRGQVWSESNVSSLLESLYYNTPCGTIILWTSQDKEYGQPFKKGKQFRYLIVDGQQRTRSLHGVINVSDEEKVWCVNLCKLKELEESIRMNIRHKKSKLFTKVKDPEKNYKRYLEEKKEGLLNYQYNFIPLKYFFNKNEFRESDCIFRDDVKERKDMKTAGKIFLDLNNGVELQDFLKLLNQEITRIKNIPKRRFFIRALEDSKFEDVIRIYNRINSAGLRVQSEEKAFATLTSFYTETYKMINKLFDNIHGDDGPDDREYLERSRESDFGFKLFIRIFILTANYHTGYSPGSSGLNFDMVKNYKEEIKSEKEWAELWRETQENIIYIKKILSEELRCDDLRFLPETMSLMPIFQLLIRFPGIKKFPRVILRLILGLYLTDEMTQRDIYRLVKKITKLNIIEIGEIKKSINWKNLLSRLEESSSLMDRYTLILYWLIRKREGFDFSYKLNGRLQDEKEKIIDETCYPEKEHLVPYSTLKDIYDLRGSRISKHMVNNIGNITYISRALNSFHNGKGSEFIKLEMEGENNLNAHFLNINEFNKIKKIINGDSSERKKIKEYENFCKERRERIVKGFREWIDELDETVNQTEVASIVEISKQEPKFIPLNKDEVEAEKKGVGNLYSKINESFSEYFDGKRADDNGRSFQKKYNGSYSVVFRTSLEESNKKEGISYKLYIDRLVDYFGLSKESVMEILTSYKTIKVGGGGEEGKGFIKNYEQVEKFLALLAGSNKS